MQAPISLVVQDLEATQTPIPKDPKSRQIPTPTKTVIVEQTVELMVAKESFKGHNLIYKNR